MLRAKIKDLEMHEADEWMIFDGVRKFDPHKKEELNAKVWLDWGLS